MAVAFQPSQQWIRRAETAARRALQLDPTNAEAQCACGQVLWSRLRGFQNLEALRELEHALELNPVCHGALLWSGCVFFHIGLDARARARLRSALAVSPNDPLTLFFLGHVAGYGWKYEEADEFMTRALQADPGGLWANAFHPVAPLYAGRLDQAEERIRIARHILPKDTLTATLEALLWARRGESDRARRILERALRNEKRVSHYHHSCHTAAAAYATIGEPDRAVEFLEKSSRTGFPQYRLFRDDPHLKPLHDHLEYRRFMSRLREEYDGYRRALGESGTVARL